MSSVRSVPSEGAISVFLLAENRLLREALVRWLSKKDDIRIVGSRAHSALVVDQIIAAKPDIVILDSVSRALSQDRPIRRLHQACPGLSVVMVGMDADESVFLRLVREGILGYVLTDASAVEVWGAIRDVASGKAVCPPSLSVALFQCVAQSEAPAARLSVKKSFDLSPRQRQLARLIREGLSNKEVAARLNLSEQTIKNHVHRMLRKVGAVDRLTLAELYGAENAEAS